MITMPNAGHDHDMSQPIMCPRASYSAIGLVFTRDPNIGSMRSHIAGRSRARAPWCT